MHAKTWIIDEGRLVLTGSANLTHNGLENNVENVTQIGRNPLNWEEIAEYTYEFERYWALAQVPTEDQWARSAANMEKREDRRSKSRSRSVDPRASGE